MARKNPTWVGRRIQAELRFLGYEVSPPSPSPNTCDGPSGPPSPTWRASLAAHRREIAAVDFFVVPTLAFRPLFGFVILRHDRRELLHIGVTDQPTPRGRPNRSSTRSRTRLAPLTCSPIAMPSTAPTSSAGSSAWAFARSSLHLALPGRIPSPSASSARFAANASISSSCSTNATRVACFARTSATTTLRGLTRVSVATAHAGARYSRSHPGVSSQSPRSAGFITATSAPPDRPPSPTAPSHCDHPSRQVCHGSIPSSGVAARVGVRVGSGANLLRACAKRFGWADHLFDRDKVSLWRLSENIRGRPLLSRATFRMAYKQHSSSVGPRSNTRTGLRQLESAP
jgi:hypothetical protein